MPTSVQLKIINSLTDFFVRTELLAWILTSTKQIDRGKTRSSSVVVRAGIFALCPSEPTNGEQFLHLFIGNWFLTVSYVVMQSSWMRKISMFICEILKLLLQTLPGYGYVPLNILTPFMAFLLLVVTVEICVLLL